MRTIIRAIPVMATALLIAAQGYAIEAAPSDVKRDECLLIAMNCKNQVDSIQQRISRLEGEISRGTVVYSVDELKVLRDKLDDANKTLDAILNSGGA